MSTSEPNWNAFYDDLLSNPYYLGTCDVLKNVTWSKIGSANMLVDRASTSSDNGRHALDPVKLEVVARISADRDDSRWLAPCGLWAGPERYISKFEDLKLKYRLVAPDHKDRPIFTENFEVALENLETLMSKVETKGYRKAGVLESPKTSIRLRHKVFELKVTDEEDDEDAFPLRDWPVENDAARDALRDMDSTHRVNRIPLYNLEGDLVQPSQCMDVLKGAVVRANFTMSHWRISDGVDNRDIYTADIRSLRVIPSPPVCPSTPRKKRASIPTVDLGASPHKRHRT
ncbi:hypothetical protein MVEN_00509000 [Mycena venus]|uniref:Uncharacterized protein n=1 Tax=Mycena venus TaxID=2733690 RepID=A0A8H6YNU7_9AGAR|nr:hypothetical protein MVEN_00509000 [Mycena venus]